MEKDQRESQEEEEPQDDIDRETAVALPKREAMSVISPPFISPIVKSNPTETTDPVPTDENPASGLADPTSET